jgi:hypothetical protein
MVFAAFLRGTESAAIVHNTATQQGYLHGNISHISKTTKKQQKSTSGKGMALPP